MSQDFDHRRSNDSGPLDMENEAYLEVLDEYLVVGERHKADIRCVRLAAESVRFLAGYYNSSNRAVSDRSEVAECRRDSTAH